MASAYAAQFVQCITAHHISFGSQFDFEYRSRLGWVVSMSVWGNHGCNTAVSQFSGATWWGECDNCRALTEAVPRRLLEILLK